MDALKELDKWAVNGMKELIWDHVRGKVEENRSDNIPMHENPNDLGGEINASSGAGGDISDQFQTFL